MDSALPTEQEIARLENLVRTLDAALSEQKNDNKLLKIQLAKTVGAHAELYASCKRVCEQLISETGSERELEKAVRDMLKSIDALEKELVSE